MAASDIETYHMRPSSGAKLSHGGRGRATREVLHSVGAAVVSGRSRGAEDHRCDARSKDLPASSAWGSIYSHGDAHTHGG